MSLYLDTSALIKAFLAEPGSQLVGELLREVGPASTSRIAYVECHAAFARGRREGRLTAGQVASLVRALEQRWPDIVVVDVDAGLTVRAGGLVHQYALRAADAIHLASAVAVASENQAHMLFACWDLRLWEAAAKSGFRMAPASPPR